jgi:hypothetical protein
MADLEKNVNEEEVVEAPKKKTRSRKAKAQEVVAEEPQPEVKSEMVDGFPTLKLKEKYVGINLRVSVGSERRVGRDGRAVVRGANVTYSANDIIVNSLALAAKHPILLNYFEPITEEEKNALLNAPTSRVSMVQRKRNRLGR